ncbi:MAG: AmmeMemoRadiSam system protein B, partial [Atribacterota bacterium]
MERLPAVSGYFYPESKTELEKMIRSFFESEQGAFDRLQYNHTTSLNGVVCPHAGYLFSGGVAAWSFYSLSRCEPVDTLVIIGPNHRGLGKRVALSSAEHWLTPLGKMEVDLESVDFLVSQDPIFSIDNRAHLHEHSVEVQIPMLQYCIPYPVRILPIILLDQTEENALRMAQSLFQLAQRKKIAIIASSDFSHYEDDSVIREKDLACISQIINLQTPAFYSLMRKLGASICGPGGIATLMEFQKFHHSSSPSLL